MRITVVHKPSGKEVYYTVQRSAVGLRLVDAASSASGDADQVLQWEFVDWRQLWRGIGRHVGRYFGRWLYLIGFRGPGPSLYPVSIHFDGRNAKVIDRGSSHRLYLLERPLPIQQSWSWLTEQELQYGDFILWWEMTAGDRRPLQQRIPLERTSRFLIVFLLIGLIGVLLISLFTSVQSRMNVITRPTVTIFPPLTATATMTPTLTLTATASPTPTLTSTMTPMPTVVTVLDARDIAATFTPMPTPTLLPAQATQAAVRLICRDTLPLPLSQDLVDLGIKIEPACVKAGEYYWQLTKAEWLDEAKSNGLHHIFVYLQSDGPLDEKITMRWETDGCTREVKDATGANCPMYNAGFAYKVQVEGLPSEKVINLGLGTIDKRAWTIRTSFYLTFTKTLSTNQTD